MAHRGNVSYGGPTENSIGAFNATFNAGAKWIETDVMFTKDAVPVLMHDSTVDRTTTGTGSVASLTAAQFTALTLNDGQKAPTLDQALDLIRADPQRRLLMEVKAITASQEQVLLDKLAGLESRVYVNAFAARLANIQRLKAANPLLNISLVTYSPVLPSPVGVSAQDMEYTYVTAERVDQLHDAGMSVRAWVANSTTAWRFLRDVGVDAVMTNSTAAYLAWAATECASTPPEPTDESPPEVSLSAPGEGATVSETFDVTGTAADDVVAELSLLVDGAVVATSAPGTDDAVAFSWNSYTVANGAHTLQLRARDGAGNIGQSGLVSVTVQNVDAEDPSPPTALSATWSSPSQVALTWSEASDNGAVTGYRVYRDDEAVATLGPNARSHNDTGVANLRTYAYHVTALDAAGNESDPTELANVETGDDTGPTAPTATVVLANTDAAELSWSGATDNDRVAGYRISRNGAALGTVDGAASTYSDTGLDDAVTYTYRVTAFDTTGNSSAPSDPVTLTTPDTTAPTAPSNLAAVSGSQSVALSWSAATDNVAVVSYVVHRDGQVLGTLPGSARSFTDNGLNATTAHQYYVTAKDAAGLAGPASNVVTRSLTDGTAPTAPTSLARTISGFTVRLTWKASNDNIAVTGYTVYRGGVAIGTTSSATAYTDSTAPPGKSYTYTVRARDAANNLSAPSTSVSATLPVDRTAPAVPTGLRATAGAAGTRQVVLTWNASTDNAGVTNYYLFRGNLKYRLLGNVLSFTDTALTAGTRYTYKLYAIDASGNWSGASAYVTVTAR